MVFFSSELILIIIIIKNIIIIITIIIIIIIIITRQSSYGLFRPNTFKKVRNVHLNLCSTVRAATTLISRCCE